MMCQRGQDHGKFVWNVYALRIIRILVRPIIIILDELQRMCIESLLCGHLAPLNRIQTKLKMVPIARNQRNLNDNLALLLIHLLDINRHWAAKYIFGGAVIL